MEGVVPAPGMVVADRYRLEDQIGEGAFSQVFRATDLELGRSVALKVLTQDSVESAGFERFRREAALAQKLANPNTVQLLDFDLEARPVPFIAYELLDGLPLDRLLRRGGPMSEARAAEITRQVLTSLVEAHHAGIVHRDVKPGNVFVQSTPGGADEVKVLDFGIARSTGPAEVALTQAGILIGTPRYMPPEQIRGEPPIPAMDLYATGMMLAEMLAGEPLLGCSAPEALLVQLAPENVSLPPSVERSRLAGVIRRATEKDCRRRYATADEMLADIEHLQGGLSTEAAAPEAEAGIDEPRLSQAPTEVMRVPPPAPPFPSEGSGSYAIASSGSFPLAPGAPIAAPTAGSGKWIVATIVLLLLAMLATAYVVYALRAGAPLPGGAHPADSS